MEELEKRRISKYKNTKRLCIICIILSILSLMRLHYKLLGNYFTEFSLTSYIIVFIIVNIVLLIILSISLLDSIPKTPDESSYRKKARKLKIISFIVVILIFFIGIIFIQRRTGHENIICFPRPINEEDASYKGLDNVD
jgi:uncharacterized membrane protein